MSAARPSADAHRGRGLLPAGERVPSRVVGADRRAGQCKTLMYITYGITASAIIPRPTHSGRGRPTHDKLLLAARPPHTPRREVSAHSSHPPAHQGTSLVWRSPLQCAARYATNHLLFLDSVPSAAMHKRDQLVGAREVPNHSLRNTPATTDGSPSSRMPEDHHDAALDARRIEPEREVVIGRATVPIQEAPGNPD